MSLGGPARARTVNEIKNRRRQSRGDVCYARDCRRRFLKSPIARALAGPPTCTAALPRGRPVDDPHEGHVKVMLAYGHTLSYGHEGFRPFTSDNREAAQPVGAAAARVEVLCDHQTVPSRALTTASTAAVEVMRGDRLTSSATTQERGGGSSRLYGLKAHP